MFFRLPIVKFFSRLLNRATITVALVLLQAGWLLWAFSYLTTGRIWVNAALRLLSLFIVLYLVRKDEDSSYKIIWIVLIGLLPLLGGALYLVFGNKAPSKGMCRRMQSVEKAHTGDLAQQPGPARQLAGDHFSGLSRYVARYGPFPVWDKTQARYFSCGEAMYPKLLADLEKAEKFIFLEYFIVRSGKMWSGVEEILMRTQKESDPFCRRKTPCRSGTALVCRNAIDCECAIPFSGISLPHMPIQFHYSMNRNFLQDRIRFSVIFVTSYRNPPFETSILYKRQHPDNGHFCRSATESPEMTAMHRNLKKPVCFTVNFCDNFMKTA